VISYRKAQ
jgi:hypothetical protein